MAHDAQVHSVYGGEAPGPGRPCPGREIPRKASGVNASGCITSALLAGLPIRFVLRDATLQPPPGAQRRPRRRLDPAKEKAARERLRAFLDSAIKDFVDGT